MILVTLDTTRRDHLGAYGYDRGTTPELDRFAQEAVVFERAWSTASWTLPAHASLFTGKFSTSHGAHLNALSGQASLGEVIDIDAAHEIQVNRLGDDELTLAELLGSVGYETAAVVGGPWLAPNFGAMQGYEFVESRSSSIGGLAADLLTDSAIAWLESVPSERSVHLFVNYFDPHWPYEPPPGYDNLPMAKLPIRTTVNDVMLGAALSSRQQQAHVDRYDGEIGFMDSQLGRLLEALRNAGRYESALIIVVADHGESFGEHELMGHGRALYEEILRVPLLIHYPEARDAGTRRFETVSLVDLLPLIAAELDLGLPHDIEGVKVGKRSAAFAEFYRNALEVRLYGRRVDRDLSAVMAWPWKLIKSDYGQVELYNLDEDPLEHESRREKPELERLGKILAAERGKLSPPESLKSPVEIESGTKEALKALGYLE